MSGLYIGTFGSFIGYSAALPLLIKSEFPEVKGLLFAALGPLVGSLKGRAFVAGGLVEMLLIGYQVFAGIGLNTNGCACGIAPTPKEPKLLTLAAAVFAVLSPGPSGTAHDEPVLVMIPISVLGSVANVEPSSAAFHPNCMPLVPDPLNRLIFQTALTTFCFSEGVKGVPFTAPFDVIPSNTVTEKLEDEEGLSVTGK